MTTPKIRLLILWSAASARTHFFEACECLSGKELEDHMDTLERIARGELATPAWTDGAAPEENGTPAWFNDGATEDERLNDMLRVLNCRYAEHRPIPALLVKPAGETFDLKTDLAFYLVTELEELERDPVTRKALAARLEDAEVARAMADRLIVDRRSVDGERWEGKVPLSVLKMLMAIEANVSDLVTDRACYVFADPKRELYVTPELFRTESGDYYADITVRAVYGGQEAEYVIKGVVGVE